MVGTVEEVTVFSLQAEENFEATFKKSERAVRSLTRKMEDYEKSIGKSSTELIILKAKQKGATDEQMRHLKAVQTSITAKQAEVDALDKASKATLNNEKTIERLVADLNREANAIGKTTQALQLERAARAGATAGQLEEIRALQSVIASKRHATNAGKGLHGQLRLMRGGFGQIGHQIQDVAVQLQMGTNAMLVFGQQGSQVASLFGPHGAMIGALLAVGAAFFTYMQASKKTKEETDKLTESIKKYVEAKREMNRVDQAFLRQKTNDEIAATEALIVKEAEALHKLQRDVRLAAIRQSTLNDRVKAGVGAADEYRTAVGALYRAERDLEEKQEELTKGTVTYYAEVQNLGRGLVDLRSGLDRLNDGKTDQQTVTEEMIATLKEELETYGMSARQLDLHKAKLDNASKEEIKAINLAHDRLDLVREATREGKEATEEQERNTAAAEQQTAANDRFVKALQLKVETLGKDARAIALLRAEQQGMTADQIEAINIAHDIKDAYDEKIAASKAYQEQLEEEAETIAMLNAMAKGKEEKTMDDYADLKDSFKGEIELLREHEAEKLQIVKDALALRPQLQEEADELMLQIRAQTAEAEKAILWNSTMAVAQAMSNQLSILAGVFGEQSALGKAAFLASQALAAGQAIMSGNSGAAAAMSAASKRAEAVAPIDPTGAMAAAHLAAGATQAAIVKGMGYISAAAIMGQTLGSFEGGGFTGSGARTGGVDGKGGFPAILHPNETVIDHTRDFGSNMLMSGNDSGQKQAKSTVVNINVTAADTKDFDRLITDRRGLIAGIVNKELNRQGRAL